MFENEFPSVNCNSKHAIIFHYSNDKRLKTKDYIKTQPPPHQNSSNLPPHKSALFHNQ